MSSKPKGGYALRGIGCSTHDEDQRFPPTKHIVCSYQDNSTGVKVGLVLEVPQSQWDNPNAWLDALTGLIGQTHDTMTGYINQYGSQFAESKSPIVAQEWERMGTPVGAGSR